MEIKRILYPTDFSEGSEAATPYVTDLVKKYGAKLFILHVVYDIANVTGWYVPHVSTDAISKEMEVSANKEIAGCCIEELRNYKDVERIVLSGIPSEEILKFTKEKGIDLIVMGTHGRKGFDRMLFGSTAEKVLRTAPCPVMTVRLPEKG
jgi:universal stress protein A